MHDGAAVALPGQAEARFVGLGAAARLAGARIDAQVIDLAGFQFARVGAHAFVGGMSGLENDLIPYGMAIGNRAHLSGLNIIGLQRRGFSRGDIHSLRRAYRLLFADEGTLQERVEDVAAEYKDMPIVQEIVAFMRVAGKRSLCTPRDPDA